MTTTKDETIAFYKKVVDDLGKRIKHYDQEARAAETKLFAAEDKHKAELNVLQEEVDSLKAKLNNVGEAVDARIGIVNTLLYDLRREMDCFNPPNTLEP